MVSPSGKHFRIEVKGQSKRNFWRFNERAPHPEMYYAFVFVPQEGIPRVFIMDSTTTMGLWREYKESAVKKGAKTENQWGINWKQPHVFEDRYDMLPQ